MALPTREALVIAPRDRRGYLYRGDLAPPTSDKEIGTVWRDTSPGVEVSVYWVWDGNGWRGPWTDLAGARAYREKYLGLDKVDP